MQRKNKPIAEESQKEKKKTKKRKRDDLTYNPRRDPNKKRKLTTGKDVLGMRCDTSKTVEKDGKEEELKVAILISDVITTTNGLSLDDIQDKVSKKIKENPTYRPLHKIVEHNANGSPVKIETPKKTVLTRKLRTNVMSFFDNRPLVLQCDVQIKQLDESHAFYQSKQYALIKQFFNSVKSQEALVTPSLFKKTDAERRKNVYPRNSTQNEHLALSGKAKDGSATKYANEVVCHIDGMKWNWLHLIAHEIWGDKSQMMENLVGGTEHANTDMIFVESQLRYLSKRYPEGFTLQSKAHLIEKAGSAKQEHLQLGTRIDFYIITKDFTLPFEFNAQNQCQPHIEYQAAMKALFQTVVELSQATSENKENIKPKKSK